MNAQWRGHPATPAQQQLVAFPHEGKRRPAQADLLIEMLRAARANRTPLELPFIVKAGIAQHGAGFKELRDRGFEVVNEMVRDDDVVRSSYRLTFDPERATR